MIKTVLCYGDSNTYGYDPLTQKRHPKNIRWTGILQELLGNDYAVIEEGCTGRTTILDDPIDKWKNGLPYLKPCLNSHKPLDIIILMLGSNDLKKTFNASTQDIANGASKLIDEINDFVEHKQRIKPTIILVSPPIVGDNISNSPFNFEFDETAITRSKEFAHYYSEVSKNKGCIFFDAAKYVTASEIDSIHLEPQMHKILAHELYKMLQ